MTKRKLTHILLIALAILTLMALTACGDKYQKSLEAEWTADENYRLVYVSNGDGTCYVSEIRTNPDNNCEYEINIPEKSPYGDTVTAVKASLERSNVVPKLIAEEDFMKNIYEPLKAGLEASGERYWEFTLNNTFMSRFTLRDSAKMTSDRALTELYKEVPITQVIPSVYMIDVAISPEELDMLEELLIKYTQYDFNSLKASYDFLYQAVEGSTLENKDDILASLPSVTSGVSKGITSINLPDTATEINENLYLSCIDLKKNQST